MTRMTGRGLRALPMLMLVGCGSSSGTGVPPATTIKVTAASYQTLPPTTTTTNPASTVTEQGGDAGEQSHTVLTGDYLYGIAKTYCVTADDIVTINGWQDGIDHQLQPGQTVKIPPNGCAPGTDTHATTDATAPGPPAATSTTFDITSSATYVVVDGDTLSGIARKNGTTVDEIIAANAWTDGVNHVIYAGLKIKLPVKAG